MDDRGLGRSLVSFAPSARRWPMGVQAGLAMAIPVVVFTLLGDTGLGLQTSMGAFTALYCASLSRTDRIRVLPFVAAGFIASAAIGAALSFTPVALALGLLVVGLAAIVLTQGLRLGPPGPMRFTLVAGAAGAAVPPVVPVTVTSSVTEMALPVTPMGAVTGATTCVPPRTPSSPPVVLPPVAGAAG